MFHRGSRAARTLIALVAIASFVGVHPAMTASMTATSCGMEHMAHHSNAPQHHAPSTNCCSACACTAVATVPATTRTIASASSEYAAPDWADAIAVALV